MFKKILIVVAIVIISGLSGIIADRYFFPRLAATKFFSKYKFLQESAENVTVINKTEQVYVREDTSINKVTNQVAPSLVNIISYTESPVVFKNGTGVIATSDGIIITYASAIMPNNPGKTGLTAAVKYKVMAGDGNSYDGELIGIDSWSNLAFIKINASNLPVISFANSDDYNPGEKVVAVGNDMSEYQNRFSTGILNSFDPAYNISGLSLSISEKLEGVYITDFGTDNFSPGGAIVDYSGQAVGIAGSVLKNNKTEYFVIPSNKIKEVLGKAVDHKLSSNVTLGAYYLMLNKSYDLTNSSNLDHGAMIFSPSGQQGLAVISGSAADKAGLRINDVIVKVNGEDINLKNTLSQALYKLKKGDMAEFTVIRSGDEIKIPVQL
jgi:serine protease Do